VRKPESAVGLAPLTLGARFARGWPADGGGSTGEVAAVEDSDSGALEGGRGGVKLLMFRWDSGRCVEAIMNYALDRVLAGRRSQATETRGSVAVERNGRKECTDSSRLSRAMAWSREAGSRR
jgi:hypothetical protein